MKNIFHLLNYTGIVPRVGTSTLDPGPAAGIVPLEAAFQKLRNQSSFYSITGAEFISLFPEPVPSAPSVPSVLGTGNMT